MAENLSSISYQQTLSVAGLTTDQATIYEVLLKNGALPAGKIHQKTPFKRGLVYKLLEQMVELGMVVKKTDGLKVAMFEPAHPLKLKELAEQQEQKARQAQSALNSVLDALTLDYYLISDKPGVKFYEGINGMEVVFDDILMHAKHLKIFASSLDAKNDQVAKLIQKQAKKQAKLGIKVQALTSANKNEEPVLDRSKLTELNISYKSLSGLALPSQITIYDQKIAITSLDKELITTFIENKAIATSFSIIFDLLWQNAGPGIGSTSRQQPLSSPKTN